MPVKELVSLSLETLTWNETKGKGRVSCMRLSQPDFRLISVISTGNHISLNSEILGSSLASILDSYETVIFSKPSLSNPRPKTTLNAA